MLNLYKCAPIQQGLWWKLYLLYYMFYMCKNVIVIHADQVEEIDFPIIVHHRYNLQSFANTIDVFWHGRYQYIPLLHIWKLKESYF